MIEFYCERCKKIGTPIHRKTNCGLEWNECVCGATNLEVWPVRTFEEWSNLDYRIKKGSKSVGKNKHGIPVFASYQTWHHSIIERIYEKYDDCSETDGCWEYWKDSHDSEFW